MTGSFPCPPEWSLQTSLVVLCEEKKTKEKKRWVSLLEEYNFCNLARSNWKRSIIVCKTTTCFDTTENILPTNQNLSFDWVRKSSVRFCSIQFFCKSNFVWWPNCIWKSWIYCSSKNLEKDWLIIALIRELNLIKCIMAMQRYHWTVHIIINTTKGDFAIFNGFLSFLK